MFRRITKLLKPSSIITNSKETLARTIKSITTVTDEEADGFIRITVDVRGYKDVKVNTGDDFIHIEGMTQERTANGFISRQFINSIKLPKGCTAKDVTPVFSEDGTLTVTVKKDCTK